MPHRYRRTHIGRTARMAEWRRDAPQRGWHRGADSVPYRDGVFCCPKIGVAMQTVVSRARQTRLNPAPTPSLDEIRSWLVSRPERPALVPIYREIMADSGTPVSAFLKIQQGQPGFILESVEGGERIARYSFIGAGPFKVVEMRDGVAIETSAHGNAGKVYDDPLRLLEEMLAGYQSTPTPGLQLPRFAGGAVGYLGYESIRAFEPRVGTAAGPGLGYPDARFMFVDSLLVFDNVSRTIKVVSHLDLH